MELFGKPQTVCVVALISRVVARSGNRYFRVAEFSISYRHIEVSCNAVSRVNGNKSRINYVPCHGLVVSNNIELTDIGAVTTRVTDSVCTADIIAKLYIANLLTLNIKLCNILSNALLEVTYLQDYIASNKLVLLAQAVLCCIMILISSGKSSSYLELVTKIKLIRKRNGVYLFAVCIKQTISADLVGITDEVLIVKLIELNNFACIEFLLNSLSFYN